MAGRQASGQGLTLAAAGRGSWELASRQVISWHSLPVTQLLPCLTKAVEAAEEPPLGALPPAGCRWVALARGGHTQARWRVVKWWA